MPAHKQTRAQAMYALGYSKREIQRVTGQSQIRVDRQLAGMTKSKPLRRALPAVPGVRQMSDADAMIAKQPINERDEQYISEQVWSIAADIRAAAMERRKREVSTQYA